MSDSSNSQDYETLDMNRQEAVAHDWDWDYASPALRAPSPVDPELLDDDDPMSDEPMYPRFEEEEEEEEEGEVYSLTLEEFVSSAQQLLRSGDMASFSRFVLNGIHEDIQHQVDPIKNALNDNDKVQALRDYDSMLGIHTDICITTELTIYPVSKFEDTLRRNVHIETSFHNQYVCLHIVHCIRIHIRALSTGRTYQRPHSSNSEPLYCQVGYP